MKFELKDYQEAAAWKVLNGLRRGSREYEEDGEYTAISLSAPTGSGKTVIAAAVIEDVFFGDTVGDAPPDPDAIFLWLTDDPSLNEQTRKRILEASDRIEPGHLVTIDDGFDQSEFDSGKVYFLNIQKLARTSNLVRRAEGKRRFPIWETITNTIARAHVHYYLVVDEAHRGTGTSARDRQTIAQRLVSGDAGVIPASPVVWGISATPERFEGAMGSSVPARLMRKVAVPVEQVRESGLIKDVLSVHHQGEQQTMETTLLREAVREFKSIDAAWRAYTEAEDEAAVDAAFVVQIPANYMDDQIGDLLDICREEWDLLTGDAFAHALESHTAEEFGQHVVRYVAPQDIQDHPTVRLVLFKEALTTGWDCPRAEVMLSLRKAYDHTYIAQLIGRMVRSPLARRIESDETLNRVLLYLPNFDTSAVKQVKTKLESDPEGAVADIVIKSVDAPRNRYVPAEVFSLMEGLVSYVVPGPIHRSQVSRLHKLAALLSGDGLLAQAIREADGFLISVIESERRRLEADGALAPLISDTGTAIVALTEVDIHADDEATTTTVALPTDIGDVDRLYKGASRKFRDGLRDTYWGHRVTHDGDDPDDAKILTVSLSRDSSVVDKVELEAALRVQQWLSTYGDAISALSEDKKAKYAEVRAMAQQPERVRPGLPTVITMPAEDDVPEYSGHVYANSQGEYRTRLGGTWERHAVSVEQNRPGFTAWYRNPTGGQRALRIPFEKGSEKQPEFGKMYPDFVFFHEDDEGTIRPSIVDPHGHHLSDAAPKLRGLADYAKEHGAEYARIVAVIRASGGDFRSLDLKEPTVRAALGGVSTKDEIEAVFDGHGAIYN
ncbi:MAG: DEAD/DEAH box helicase family protein [Thermoleophilaceae bacterium]